MKSVVGGITANQSNGSKWLLSDAIVDLIHVYMQCNDTHGIPEVERRLQEVLEEESYSSKSQELVKSLKELSMKIRDAVAVHLKPFLEPHTGLPQQEKYHMIFSLFLDPRFVNLKPLLEFHLREYNYEPDYKIVYSKPYIKTMKDKLLDYIAAAENEDRLKIK